MSDAILHELINHMATDAGFSERVKSDPAALDGFDLTSAERTALTSLEDDSGKGAEGLPSRESKSSIFNLGGLHEGSHHVPVSSDPDITPAHHAPVAPAPPVVHEATSVQAVPSAPHSPADSGFLSPVVGIVDAVAPIAKGIPGVGLLAGAAKAAVDLAGGIVGGHSADTGDHVHAATAPDGTPVAPPPVTAHAAFPPPHPVVPGAIGHVPPGASNPLTGESHVPPGASHLPPGATAAPPAGPAPVPAGPPVLGGSDGLGGGLVGGGAPSDPGHVQGGMPVATGLAPSGGFFGALGNPASGGLIPGDPGHFHAATTPDGTPVSAPPAHVDHVLTQPNAPTGPGHVPPPPGIGHGPAPIGAPASSPPDHVSLTPSPHPGQAPSGTVAPDVAGSHPAGPPVHTPPPVPSTHGHPVASDGQDVKPTLGGVRQYLQGGSETPDQ